MERTERHETYVTFAQAHSLKRLGFDWECFGFYERRYTNSDEMWLRVYLEYENHNERSHPSHEVFSAPALHIAAKWLREVKGLAVNVLAHDGGMYDWEMVFLPNADGAEEPLDRSTWCETYEEALSEGITTTLKYLEGRQ